MFTEPLVMRISINQLVSKLEIRFCNKSSCIPDF